MHPANKSARVAGLLHLLVGGTARFGLICVPSKLIVSGNATATANNILGSEMLFRIGIVTGLISTIAFMFVVMAPYRPLMANPSRITTRPPPHRPLSSGGCDVQKRAR